METVHAIPQNLLPEFRSSGARPCPNSILSRNRSKKIVPITPDKGGPENEWASALAISTASSLAEELYGPAEKRLIAPGAPGQSKAVDPRRIGIRRFIVDTGCGYNLLSRDTIERASGDKPLHSLENNVLLHTAGGPVECKTGVNVNCPALDEGKFQALVLDNTPEVLSVGQRCQEFGYGFYWTPWSDKPYLCSPSGQHIELTVDGAVPYLEVPDSGIATPAELRMLALGAESGEDAAPLLHQRSSGGYT